jgi:hypothetical protein
MVHMGACWFIGELAVFAIPDSKPACIANASSEDEHISEGEEGGTFFLHSCQEPLPSPP